VIPVNQRAIPVSWRRPEREVLLEDRYKYSRPPFDPFPDVTNVVNAAKCPVAILHDILHAIEDATIPGGKYGLGVLYQRFIAHLKLSAARKDFPSTSDVRYRFEMFARDENDKTKADCWRYYVEPWCSARLDRLQEANENIFFEVSVANAYVPFKFESKNPTYPLRGRIDEIDLKNCKIIERTIKGRRADQSPPPLKDFQVWLLWKALSTIEKRNYSEPWKGVDFEDFELIVETPYHEFVVKDNPDFENLAHIAYAWIKDLAGGGKSEFEAYQHRACTHIKTDMECGARWSCFGRRYKYPECRGEVHKEIRKFYPPLFWQQMWDYQLFRYQLLMLEKKDLEDLGYLSEGRVVSFKDGKIEIEITPLQASPILERRTSSGEPGNLLVIGSFSLGFELDAVLEEITNNKFVMNVGRKKLPPSERAMILPSESSILKTSPWFLSRYTQRDLFRLERWGLDKDENAEKHSVIQLLECLFGRKTMRRETS